MNFTKYHAGSNKKIIFRRYKRLFGANPPDYKGIMTSFGKIYLIFEVDLSNLGQAYGKPDEESDIEFVCNN